MEKRKGTNTGKIITIKINKYGEVFLEGEREQNDGQVRRKEHVLWIKKKIPMRYTPVVS